MHNADIKITIEDYDKNHVIAFVEKNEKSMLLIFGLYDFTENMEFWGIKTFYGSKNNREGIVFENTEEVVVKAEIEIFITQYNLSKYNP